MADLRYKVVVDDAEARKKLRELLSNTGVSSPTANVEADAKKTTDALTEVQKAQIKAKEAAVANSKAITDAKVREIDARAKNKAAIDAERLAQSKDKNDASIANAKALKDAQLATIEALRQTRLEMAKQKKEQGDLNTSYLQGRIALQEFRAEQARLNAARKEEARLAREAKKFLQQNSEYAKLTAELNKVRKQAKDVLAEMARLERQGYKTGAAYQSLRKRSSELVSQTQILDRTVKKIDITVGQHQRNVGNYGDALTMVMPQLSQFTGRLGLLAAGVAAVKQSFDTNLRLEPINQALLTASGTTQNFDRNLEFLRVTSDRLGLQFVSTATSFKLWQGAAKFSNLTARESRDIFESVANAGAKMKLSNDQVEATFLALSQMMSKGKVQAEELRGQLGERLPGAFSLAAKAMGVTEQALNKMLEQGEVLSAEFLPKFAAELDKTFGNDKSERIEGMQAAVNRLSNEFDALWQSERATSFFTTVSDGFARMFKEINLMINSKSWAEFKAIGFGGLDEHAKWKKSQLSPLQQVLDGFASMPKAEMEKSIVAYKEAVDLAKRENDGSAKKLENLKFQESVLYSMTEEYRTQYGIAKSVAKLDDGKAKAKALKEAERLRQATERQRALQLSINQMNEDASRNQLSRDQEEIASIRDKYAKIREEARKFEADPKNKGLRVDLGGLRRSENFEISEAITRQDTTKLVDQLNKQKAIYDEYNAYVEDNGIESADRLYGKQAEIAKAYRSTLDSEYFDLLGRQQLASTGGASAGKFTQAEEERLKMLQDMRDNAAEQEQARVIQRNAALLKQYETYAQKRAQLVKRSQKDIADLERRGETERANRAKQILEEEQKQLFQEEIENSARFKRAIEDIDKSSQWLLAAAFKTGKETVFSLIDGMYDATPEQRKALKKLFGDFFDKGAASATLGDYEAIETMANGFGQLVQMSLQFDDNMASALKSIGGMVSQIGTMAKSLSSIGSGMSKAGGVLGIVGAFISVFGGISEAIEASYQKRALKEREAAEYQIKQLDAVTKALEYQLSIIQEIYGTDRVKAYHKAISDANQAANDSIANLAGSGNPYYLQTDNTGQNQFIDKFNKDFGSLEELDKAIAEAEKKADSFWNRIKPKSLGKNWETEVGFLKDLRNSIINTEQYSFTWKKIEDITQEEVTKLRNMLEQGKFDEVTAAQLENVIEQWEIWKEAMNQMREEVTGISFKSLTDGIISLFEQGKTSVEDFTEFFEKQMQQAILRGFSRDAIEKQMQPWYELFAQYSEDGLTQDEITKLREQYLSIMGNAEKQWEDLKKVTGQDFAGDSTSSVKSESIAQSITESTGSEIVGTFRAGYDIWKRQLITMELQSKTQISLLQVANDKLLVLNAINTNTANTVARLDTAVKHLQNIDKNLGGAHARN